MPPPSADPDGRPPLETAETPALIVYASGVDGQELEQRLCANMAQRRPLPPVPASLGRARLADERRQLLAVVRELQAGMHNCGRVGTRRRGWVGAVEVFVKKSLRRLFLRHHLQQHRVHLKLLKVFTRLVRYLEDHDECLRSALDQGGRQCQEASDARGPATDQARPSPTPERPARRAVARSPR